MRNPALWVLLVCSSLVAAYLVFLGAISISVGFQHMDHEGSWMPLVAGLLCVVLVLCFFYRIMRSVLQALRKKDGLNVQ